MRAVNHEIVRVVQPAFLVNSAREACRYETADDRVLERGYYFALWPTKAARRVYDRKVCYFGPFETPEMAQFVETCAAYFGFVSVAVGAPQRQDDSCLLTVLRLPAQDDRATHLSMC